MFNFDKLKSALTEAKKYKEELDNKNKYIEYLNKRIDCQIQRLLKLESEVKALQSKVDVYEKVLEIIKGSKQWNF